MTKGSNCQSIKPHSGLCGIKIPDTIIESLSVKFKNHMIMDDQNPMTPAPGSDAPAAPADPMPAADPMATPAPDAPAADPMPAEGETPAA